MELYLEMLLPLSVLFPALIGESGWAISRTLSGVIYCVWLGYTPHALWRDLLCLVGLYPARSLA